MAEMVNSRNGIPIRLTDERWSHVTEEHSELAGMRFEVLETIEQADRVYVGGFGELLAIREIESGKFIVVVYRENSEDGFLITAFVTRRLSSIEKRKLVWSAQK